MVEKTRTRSLSRPRISLKPRQSKSNQPDETKLLHVSVTIQSLSGVYFKESTKSKNTNQTITVYPKTTVVATYSRDGTQDNTTMDDHIRSLPLDLSRPTSKDSEEVATWLSSEKSTFTFERYFHFQKQKKKSRKKEMSLYISQSCRVQLAVCRNSRWFKLGDADIIIQGNEQGRVLAVPLINGDQPKTKKGNKVIPMARLKGETLKCGLGNNAMLSVVVNVSESPKENPNSNLTLKKAENQPKEGGVLIGKGRMLQERSTNEPILKVDFQPIQDKNIERLETITSSVADSAANGNAAVNQEITKVAGLPPIRVNSTSSKISSKSRSENILDQITAAVNDSSQESQSANLHQPSPPKPLTPVATRAGFVPIHLSPFRSLSSPHLMSEDSEPKTSILDRVIPIASDSTDPRERSRSQHLSSLPDKSTKRKDQNCYFIEHDFQPTDDPSCTGLNKEKDILTASTEKSSSQSDSIFDYSQSSGFTYSHNSAFATASGSSKMSTTASGYSSSKAGTSQGEDNMESVMAELLEKSPSELYAIIHDIDPEVKRKEKSQRKESAQIILEKETGYESDLLTDNSESYDYESAGESSFFYESDEETSIGSTFNSSYVSFAEKKGRREKSFVESIFGRACNSLCGLSSRGGDKTLSYVDDDEIYVNGREYIDNLDDTWTSTEGTKKHRSKWSRVE